MIKKVFLVSIPAILAAMLVVAIGVELAVRVTWDPRRGRPGLFVADPVRIERLSPGYDGWFAGVPIHINALGFRDTRDYALAKSPQTFRILVLGDSVTFGHGSVYEHTYPFLLEQRLKAWKPGVDWQVWNLGVPGYNTSQELAYLEEIGPESRPDLVIVGFFGNDVSGNAPVVPASRRAALAAAVKSWLRRNFYTFDLYKKVLLALRSRWSGSQTERDLLENLAEQERLVAKPADVADLREQQLTNPLPFDPHTETAPVCNVPLRTNFSVDTVKALPGLNAWIDAVRAFQRLHQNHTYRVAFFVNNAPAICRTEAENLDIFDARATRPLDDFYLSILADGTPAVSSHDAFTVYRPSQMPNAGAHSIGNSNAVKADVLFRFLRDTVLTGIG